MLSYYHPFLCRLADELRDDAEKYLICGSNLAGFGASSSTNGGDEAAREKEEDAEEEAVFGREREWAGETRERVRTDQEDERKHNKKRRRYFDLNQQIRFVECKLRKCVQQWQDYYHGIRSDEAKDSNDPWSQNGSRPRPKVIIVGHSVGAYIAMEILRRHRERIQLQGHLNEHDDDEDAQIERKIDMHIVGEVLLFPTIVDIAKSSAGAKLTVRSALLLLFPFHFPL